MYSQISPNPEVKEVDACAALMKEEEVEFTVALGGGSALDCAKAASTICFTEDSIRKYHGTGVPLPEKHLPIIAIPTTAGTGSEVTCVSVLSDHELGKKGPINNNNFYPAVALIDPELTYTLPPYMTASCGNRCSLPRGGGLLEQRPSAHLRRPWPCMPAVWSLKILKPFTTILRIKRQERRWRRLP